MKVLGSYRMKNGFIIDGPRTFLIVHICVFTKAGQVSNLQSRMSRVIHHSPGVHTIWSPLQKEQLARSDLICHSAWELITFSSKVFYTKLVLEQTQTCDLKAKLHQRKTNQFASITLLVHQEKVAQNHQ